MLTAVLWLLNMHVQTALPACARLVHANYGHAHSPLCVMSMHMNSPEIIGDSLAWAMCTWDMLSY